MKNCGMKISCMNIKCSCMKIKCPCMMMKIFLIGNSVHKVVYSPTTHKEFLGRKIHASCEIAIFMQENFVFMRENIILSCHGFFMHETLCTN